MNFQVNKNELVRSKVAKCCLNLPDFCLSSCKLSNWGIFNISFVLVSLVLSKISMQDDFFQALFVSDKLIVRGIFVKGTVRTGNIV